MTTPRRPHPPALDGAELDDLLREVLGRVHGVLDQQARLRLLLDAVITMAADLSLDGDLSHIVSIASGLVDAQYAALGVLEVGAGNGCDLHPPRHGSDVVGQIGDLPTGTGCSGCSSTSPADPAPRHRRPPASYGFPPHHPPMASFLGVPVRIRGDVFGNLYLTEKAGGGDFTDRGRES